MAAAFVNIAFKHELEIAMTRSYRMRLRAERQAATRRRIVEAAAQLHRSRGLHLTSISDIARLAGVERPTVVRHFPTRLSLIVACTLPATEQDPPPDPAAWRAIRDPEARLQRALTEQYAYYRRNRAFLAPMADTRNDEFAPVRELMRPHFARAQAILAKGWRMPDSHRQRFELAISHAFGFWAWVSLADLGMADEDAAALMLSMVHGIASA